jgi:ATP-dependent Clp protease ATP-binding subunit ClpA
MTIPDECINEIVKMTEEHMKKRTQPDKSIITMDAACAWQNMFKGENRTLTIEAVHRMVARETGLKANALSDATYDAREAFDPTKMGVQVGMKNFQDKG